jgi:hypothetical protein
LGVDLPLPNYNEQEIQEIEFEKSVAVSQELVDSYDAR